MVDTRDLKSLSFYNCAGSNPALGKLIIIIIKLKLNLMSILKLIIHPNKILRKKTKKIKYFNNKINIYIKNMFDTMNYYNGIGLASNQVNINKSLIVIKINKKKLILINPKIIKKKQKINYKESCLSIPNKIYITKRYNIIKIKTNDKKGKLLKLNFKGLLSICVQHEIDHLRGKLIIDF